MLDLACALAFFLAVPRSTDEPLAIGSRIKEVTVFPGNALVQRTADLPAGGGRFVLQGLPWSMDPASVVVRCFGATVIGTETRERMQPAVPNARVQELRQSAQELEHTLQELQDDLAVAKRGEELLSRWMQLQETRFDEQVHGGQMSPDTWSVLLQLYTQQLTTLRKSQRELGWKVDSKSQELKDLRLELGQGEAAAGTYLRDVIVEVASSGARGAVLDLEYMVASAGWQPLYDLRTASDARSVELSYRAQVWQQSGEDWVDAELSLSTARPHLGAQGPDPEPVWLRLFDPEGQPRVPSSESLKELGYATGDARKTENDKDAAEEQAPPPFASVASEGLSVRFKLAGKDTIQSRAQPTTVLVGQTKLALEAEHFATPALDTNVWLRGRTRNTSEWTLLPGRASVYFGADFLGHAELASVQPGEEFTLHLGPDPGLSVERTQIEDLTKAPGVFSSKSSRTETWKIRVKNHGAAAAQPDGSAVVLVREALPRSTDERLKIELVRAEPAVSTDERWAKDLAEKGIQTWVLRVPRDGEAVITLQTRITFPEGTTVLR